MCYAEQRGGRHSVVEPRFDRVPCVDKILVITGDVGPQLLDVFLSEGMDCEESLEACLPATMEVEAIFAGETVRLLASTR